MSRSLFALGWQGKTDIQNIQCSQLMLAQRQVDPVAQSFCGELVDQLGLSTSSATLQFSSRRF